MRVAAGFFFAINFIAIRARRLPAGVVFQHKCRAMPHAVTGLSLELPAFTPSIGS
jgi:hypothetical protein